MDLLQFHYNKSIFSKSSFNPQYWNPEISWKNKYKDATYTIRKRVWVFNKPVFLSDAWHLFKFIFINSLCLAIGLIFSNLILALIIRAIIGISFYISYNTLIKNK